MLMFVFFCEISNGSSQWAEKYSFELFLYQFPKHELCYGLCDGSIGWSL